MDDGDRLVTHSAENLRLAYTQQVENVREAKRLQWQMTYLGLVALAALAGAYQLLNQPATSIAARIFTGLGALVAVVTSGFIVKAMRNMGTYRKALEDIAGKLDDRSHPYLKPLLGVPRDYGSQHDAEPFFLIAALVVGAVILGWLLLGTRTPATPLPVHACISTVYTGFASASWWPLSPEGGAAIAGTLIAVIALGKQYRDEHNRRKTVDGRISAQAYAARRTIRQGWLDHPLRKAGPGAGTPRSDVNAGTAIASEFGQVENRFEQMAADAPDATKPVGRAVRDALVVFYRATHRIQADLYRSTLLGGPKKPAEFATAF